MIQTTGIAAVPMGGQRPDAVLANTSPPPSPQAAAASFADAALPSAPPASLGTDSLETDSPGMDSMDAAGQETDSPRMDSMDAVGSGTDRPGTSSMDAASLGTDSPGTDRVDADPADTRRADTAPTGTAPSSRARADTVIHAALAAWIEQALALAALDEPSLSGVRPSLEIPVHPDGGEWTGLCLTRLPTATVRTGYVSGGSLADYGFQLALKQAVDGDPESALAGATALDVLAGTLAWMFRRGMRPDFPPGVRLRGVAADRQSTLRHTDGRHAGYVLDLRFTVARASP